MEILITICDRDRNWSLNFTNFDDDCEGSFILVTVSSHGHQKIDESIIYDPILDAGFGHVTMTGHGHPWSSTNFSDIYEEFITAWH